MNGHSLKRNQRNLKILLIIGPLAALRTLYSISRRFPGRLLDNLRSPEPRAYRTRRRMVWSMWARRLNMSSV